MSVITTEQSVVELAQATSTLASTFPLTTDHMLVHSKKGSKSSANVLYELLSTIISGGDYVEVAKGLKVDIVEKAIASTIEETQLVDRIKQIQDHYKHQIEIVRVLH